MFFVFSLGLSGVIGREEASEKYRHKDIFSLLLVFLEKVNSKKDFVLDNNRLGEV